MKTFKPVRVWYRRWMREAPTLPDIAAPHATSRHAGAARDPRDASIPPTVEPRYAMLVNPFYPKDPHASFGKHVLTPTLALTSFAAATPAHWRLRYWDENLLQGPPPVRDGVPEVVAITVHLTFADRAYELARWFRSLGSKVILGGLHVLSCPDECLPHADAIVLGEGVHCWADVLADVEAGAVKRRYYGSFRKPYRLDPPPRRDLLPRESFLTTASLIATRGCHNRCDFCYLATDGLSMPYQTLTPQQVVDQFGATREPYAVFTDNNLGSKPAYLRQLCHALRPLEKIWSAAVTLDVTDDPDLVREMARAGCTGVFIGLESLSDQNIVDSGKRSPRAEEYARRVEIFHRVGIQVNASFVLGFDHDDDGVFDRTATWIESNRLQCATFHILTPYPGTPLFAQMERDGRILHRDWSKYDTGHVVFKPARMSPETLAAGYAWCYQRLFSHASIFRRRPRDLRAVPAYLAMSYLYKRCNWLWPLLIRHRLVHRAWRPLVELTRRRHVRFRRSLDQPTIDATLPREPTLVVPASV
jgi:radical SAM superfamily enzyme YgiQ (UPF0313 family)